MAVLRIYAYPNQALKQRAKPVTDFGPEMQKFFDDLTETMYEEDGVGLAAIQVGVPKQVFVAVPTMKRGEEIVVVNPEIYEMQGSETDAEGCLSLPEINGKVPRAKKIRVRFQDRYGKKQDLEASDFFARVMQHETDHLNGLLFIDRVDFNTRQELLAQYTQGKKAAGKKL